MAHLYQRIQEKVAAWRQAGYRVDAYPALAEILDHARLPETGALRFLRAAQLQALETYWYLRLVEGTPHIFDLYRRYYPRTSELLEALGLQGEPFAGLVMDEGKEALWQRIRDDEDFVRAHRLESVRETLALDYPSYILALAMGAGKTMLIGAIAATEFALALEYHPAGNGPFIQNALVFAPGLTILESLRELAEVDYSQILPPRLYRPFEATYKLIFTRDGEKDLAVVRGSRYNLVVSNTEKIRIQKRVRRHPSWTQLQFEQMVRQSEEEANLRLQAVASLPNLGVFSDEAHHTYGQEVGQSLKRVRQTVDYLHQNTGLTCVVNTTGTPYYQRQPLRDVVVWYGLSQGIRDDILKSLEGSIYAYDFDPAQAGEFVAAVVRDFFQAYGDVTLPNGAPARLALYFPQTADLQELRPVVERTLLELGQPLDTVLRNTSHSTQAEIDAFNRLNDPRSPHRVILLVNKGTEGWDCPSLFACALARRLKRSQNFVLQASTRCLRQVPGNAHRARIYLSMDNRGTLDQQLQETYGETIQELARAGQETRRRRLVVRKLDVPPLVVTRIVRRVLPAAEAAGDGAGDGGDLHLAVPRVKAEPVLVQQVYTLGDWPERASVLHKVEETGLAYEVPGRDLYSAATGLAAVYRLDAWALYGELRRLYGAGSTVPEAHLPALAAQIESRTQRYRVEEEEVEVALALLKPEGFQEERGEDGSAVYTAEITYHKSKEELLLSWQQMAGRNPGNFGFHYDPYNFDSRPEADFFLQMLQAVNVQPDEVEDLYFTGGLHDPEKTDVLVEYKGEDGRWHTYSPDFVIRRKDGRCIIVEIKDARMRQHPVDGENGRKAMAVRRWVGLNPETLRYEMVFTGGESIGWNDLEPFKEFVREPGIGQSGIGESGNQESGNQESGIGEAGAPRSREEVG